MSYAKQMLDTYPRDFNVDAGMADEDASCHRVSSGGMAAASHDGDGRSSRTSHEHQLSRSDHRTSTMYPRALAGAWIAWPGVAPPAHSFRIGLASAAGGSSVSAVWSGLARLTK